MLLFCKRGRSIWYPTAQHVCFQKILLALPSTYSTWPLFQKVISENRGLREVVDSFYENLTAITERDGTLSEACRKCSSDSLQNMIQNELKHFETVVNVPFLQEIVTFALLKY